MESTKSKNDNLAVPPTAALEADTTTQYTPSILTEKEKQEDASQHSDIEAPKVDDDLQRVVSSEYPKALKLLAILIAVMLAVFLVALDMTIVATAIPKITDQFKSLDDVGWYGSAFFLTLAGFQSTWGKAYKYFSLKTAFLVAVFWFEVGSLICAVAKNSTTLIVGRAIAGAGGAGIGAGAYTILAFSAPPKQTAALTGLLGAVFAVASVVGPLLGGVFTDNLSWRWCFYINLPIGGVSAAIIFLTFTPPKAAKPVEASLKEKIVNMDPLGTFVFMGAIVCLILALQWGGVTKSWGSADVIGVIVGFALIMVLFLIIEIRLGDRALLVPRLLKQRTITLISFFQFFNNGVFMVLLYYLPIYFQVVSGVSAAQSGVRNVPYILGAALFTIVAGVIITATGHYIPVIVLGSVLGVVGSGLIYTFDIGTPSSRWIGYQALVGIGMGLGIQVPMIVGQGVVQNSDISSISAIMMYFQTLAGAIFVSLAQSLFTNKLVQSVSNNVPGVNPGLVVATGATELRDLFSGAQLEGIIRSYMDGLKDAYVLAIALAGVAVIVSIVIVVFDRRRLVVRGAIPASA